MQMSLKPIHKLASTPHHTLDYKTMKGEAQAPHRVVSMLWSLKMSLSAIGWERTVRKDECFQKQGYLLEES